MWGAIRRAVENGRTVLMTTHVMEEAQRLADKVIIIDRGRVVVGGEPRKPLRVYPIVIGSFDYFREFLVKKRGWHSMLVHYALDI